MPRKRNADTERAISQAARSIMTSEGYEAVTYTELAARTGLPRGTVQYYFPKKEAFAMSLMGDVASLATEAARAELGEEAHPLSLVYATGQIVLGVYYSTPGMRRFMLEVSSDRRLQHAVSPDWIEWLRQTTGLETLEVSQDQLDRITMANGGVYEMYFVCLSEGRTPDFARLTRAATLEQGLAMGLRRREANDLLDRGVIAQERAAELGFELAERLAQAPLA